MFNTVHSGDTPISQPRPQSLDLTAFNAFSNFACNIKSWEIRADIGQLLVSLGLTIAGLSTYSSQTSDNFQANFLPDNITVPYMEASQQQLDALVPYTLLAPATAPAMAPAPAAPVSTVYATTAGVAGNLVTRKLCRGDKITQEKSSLQLCDATVFPRIYCCSIGNNIATQ